MLKNTNSRTATTFTLADQHPNFESMDAEMLAEVAAPYTWKNEDSARDAVRMLIEVNGFEYTHHTAPGVEVYAFYVLGRMLTVVVFEDDAAVRLHKAVRNARPVTITYTKADGEETVRTIEPTALALTKSGAVLVKAADRLSGDRRSFRLDRVSAYTVHRTRFTVRTEAPAPTKAELAEAFQASLSQAPELSDSEELWAAKLAATAGAPRVRLEGRGWTGHLDLSTEAFGPSGWSAKVTLDPEFAHLAVSGSLRVGYDDLVHI